jgi:hypothetical protein
MIYRSYDRRYKSEKAGVGLVIRQRKMMILVYYEEGKSLCFLNEVGPGDEHAQEGFRRLRVFSSHGT